MTKQQLVDSLSTKYYKVPEPVLLETHEGIRVYRILPWVKDGNRLYRNDLAFCVEKEGEPEETAYWAGKDPTVIPEQTFTQKAVIFINDKITDGTVKFGYLVSSNDTLKKALAKAITATNAEKNVLIMEIDGTLSITIL